MLRHFLRTLSALALIALVFLAPTWWRAEAQWSAGTAKGPDAVGTAVGFAVSKAARDLPAPPPESGLPDRDRPRIRIIPNREFPKAGAPAHPQDGLDLARQSSAPEPNMPAPLGAFEGLNNTDNFTVVGFRVSPPDTNGDVGPGHYVQTINLLVRVYDKTGAPLTAPFKMSSLFAPLGGICSTNDNGDPIVLYDPLADRWLISQFAFTGLTTPPYHQCIAVSRTGNPAGTYNLYDFVMPGSNFNDYPHFGVWPDAYYMTDVQFLSGGSFNGTGAFAFDRAKMLAGDPTASFIYFNLDLASHPEGIGGLLPADLDGKLTPPAGAPNPMAYFVATEFGDPIDGLRIFDFHADFASPASSTFVERPGSPLPVAAFDPISLPGRDDIPQPGVVLSQFLDSISDRLMHRLQYRNRGGFESLVVNHTVDADPAGAFLAAVRYYELRNPAPGGAYFVQEQATFAPDTTHRWMGSAAVDHQGNLAVGYSVSSAAVFPGIRYAGRLVTDPPGGLFQGEATLIPGSGVQTSTSSRWGDYSMLAVDPVDECTFWYTTEYYTAASQATSPAGWLTRIGRFAYPSCVPAPIGSLTVTVTECAGGAPVDGATVSLNGVLYGTTGSTGVFTNRVAPGTYTVSAAKAGLGTGSTSATVPNGGSTSVGICLGAVADVDLIMSKLAAPAKSGAGAAILVKYGIQNIGSTGSGPTTTSIYLSADATLSGSDTLLGTDPTAPVGPGLTVLDSLTVTIPGGTAPGTYFLIALADSGNTEAEADEGNNTRAKKIKIGPDLMISSFSVSPTVIAPGGTTTISETTKNVGGAPTGGPSSTRYFLSKNGLVDAGDVLLGTHAVPALAPNATDSQITVVTIPLGTAPGTYRIIGLADATGVIAEANELNNRKSVAVTVP